MRVLKAIDDGLSRGKKPAEMELLITKEDKLLTRGSFHLEDDETRKDEVSHFALRLAYCRTEELRRWFLAQECALFRHRFRQLRGAQQAAFLQHNGLDYHPIDAKEFERVRADLHNTLNGMMRKDDANAALNLCPTYKKAAFRHAVALFELERYVQAHTDTAWRRAHTKRHCYVAPPTDHADRVSLAT